jgi:hypothetical protein
MLSHLPHLALSPVHLGSVAPRLRHFASVPEHCAHKFLRGAVALTFDITLEGMSWFELFVHKREEKSEDTGGGTIGGGGIFGGVWRWLEAVLSRISVRIELHLLQGQLMLIMLPGSGRQ